MQSLPPYRHDPYHGLATLDPAHTAGLSLGRAIEQAEQELGCVPKGRLEELVMLCVASCVIQRLRNEQGEPLLVIKGGLVTQELLGEHARYTPDVDAVLRCEIDECIQRLPEAFDQPWGQVRATLQDVVMSPYGHCPYDMFGFQMLLEADDCEPKEVTIDVTCGPTAQSISIWRGGIPALAGVGLPEPDAFWTTTPEAVVADKIAASAELNEFDLDSFDYESLVAIHGGRAKHLIDLLWLSHKCDAGEIPNDKVVQAVEKLNRVSAPVRIEHGYPPLPRVKRVKAWEFWRNAYFGSAMQAGLFISMEEAVREVNSWLERIGL